MEEVGARGVMQRKVGWILKAEIVAPERTAPMAVSLNSIVAYEIIFNYIIRLPLSMIGKGWGVVVCR